jgi:hypothetical protein
LKNLRVASEPPHLVDGKRRLHGTSNERRRNCRSARRGAPRRPCLAVPLSAHGGHANFISEVAVALQGEGKIKTAVEISARDTAVTACILLQQGGSPKILHSVLTPNGDGRALGLLDILLFEAM